MKTWEDLKDYVGAGSSSDAQVQGAFSDAQTLVTSFVGVADIPADVLDLCYLRVGAELFHAKNAPNGLAQFTGFDGTPVRIARNPMVSVLDILSIYMVIGL